MRVTEQRKFPSLIRDFVLAHGGRIVEKNTVFADNGERIRSWDLDIPTQAGILQVRPMEDWVACRFEDVERARSVLPEDERLNRLNQHSGKWNHHFYDHDEADTAAAHFGGALRRILPEDANALEINHADPGGQAGL